MRVQLANVADRRWWSEGGAATWGFGIEVTHYGSEHWDEATDTTSLVSEGHEVSIMLGPWSLVFFSKGAFRAVHGEDIYDLYKPFEVIRP